MSDTKTDTGRVVPAKPPAPRRTRADVYAERKAPPVENSIVNLSDCGPSAIVPQDTASPDSILAFFTLDNVETAFKLHQWTVDKEVQALVGMASDEECDPRLRFLAMDKLRRIARESLTMSGGLQTVTGHQETTDQYGNVITVDRKMVSMVQRSNSRTLSALGESNGYKDPNRAGKEPQPQGNGVPQGAPTGEPVSGCDRGATGSSGGPTRPEASGDRGGSGDPQEEAGTPQGSQEQELESPSGGNEEAITHRPPSADDAAHRAGICEW